jgi:hypothetical protein
MNRIVQRLGACVAASVFGLVGLLILMGCGASPATNSTEDVADINFSVSNASPDGSGAPNQVLQVDMHVFAEKGQNPFQVTYTVTNIHPKVPLLAPLFIEVFDGEHIKILEANPVSGTVLAKSLQPMEAVTGTVKIYIEEMQWQEGFGIGATTNPTRDPDFWTSKVNTDASAQGGMGFAFGGNGVTFRTKAGRIEISQFGWPDSQHPGFTTFDDGTRVMNATYDPNNPNIGPHMTLEVQPTAIATVKP